MSQIKDMLLDIQEAISDGLPFDVIARQLDIPEYWVTDAAKLMDEYDEPDPGYMDGDEATALASAGFGTDEDYGYAGDFGDF